jgi:hypothetical protein
MDSDDTRKSGGRIKLNLDAVEHTPQALEFADLELGDSARAAMAHFSSEIDGMLQEWREHFSRSMAETFAGISRQLRETTQALEPDALRMGELGWTVPTWEALPSVRSIVLNVPPEELDAFFASLYSRRFREQEREMLRELPARPLLTRWSPLLQEVVKSYRKRHYLVAIPALLAVFEGALAEAGDTIKSKQTASVIAKGRVRRLDAGVERLAWVSLVGFCSTVFRTDHVFSGPAPDRLNRHWVQHGRSEPTWTRVDCLRMFQALDTLATLTRSAQTREG